MNRIRSLSCAALAALLAAAAPASAIDLTGTWVSPSDTVRCKVRSGADTGFTQIDGNIAELRIDQNGEELWIEINPGGAEYENKYSGVAFTSPKSDAKGYGVASACTVPGKFYAGTFEIVKAKTDGDRGKLTFRYTGTRLGAAATCTGRLERTSIADPGITLTCP